MLKRLLLGLAAVVAVLAAVCVIRTLSLPSPPGPLPAPAPLAIDDTQAIQRFSAAIRVRTISEPEQPPDRQAFDQLRAQIEQDFPLVQAHLQREIVGVGALLYTWPGSDPSLKPALLMGHMDVVPVDAATLSKWTHPPYDGLVADGFVWGRGTLDDKSAVFSTLEAAEALLQAGFTPKRTLIFAFGDDEEVGGSDGAAQIVERLKQRGTQLEFVLDEGGSVTRGIVPGVVGDVALVGIAEKGYVSVRLRVHAEGGHSSMPQPQTAIGILSRALARLEAHQMPERLTPVGEQMLDALAPQQPFAQRLVLSNRWLFRPLIVHLTGATPAGAASLRTTTAETMFNAGVKDNVLPTEATAVVNFRILPGDTIDSVFDHVRRTIADPRVELAKLDNFGINPSPISSTTGFGFRSLSETIRAEFPQATVAPYLVVGATDSAHYEPLTRDIFRFSPIVLEARDLERMHGIDERLPTKRYLKSIQFMGALMRKVAG